MQHQNHHHQPNGNESPHQLLPHVVGAGSGSTRPGSMADRARMAKLPPPETALKCPRCESTNTKFCYFNNYSLSQPRHFCKTCRRYWTRGGALRNVPVGGGCRRNKKSKRSRSGSPANNRSLLPDAATTAIPSGSELMSQQQQQQASNFPFMASLQSQMGLGLGRYGAVGNMGLNLREILQAQTEPVGFSMGGGVQFPNFLNGFESNCGDSSSYQFQSHENNNNTMDAAAAVAASGMINGDSSNSRVTTSHMPAVKLEENGALNLSSRSSSSLFANNNNTQYYPWTTDLSALASSSATQLL